MFLSDVPGTVRLDVHETSLPQNDMCEHGCKDRRTGTGYDLVCVTTVSV